MKKIKIVTDSACDITKELEKEHDVLVMSFPITVGEESYMERIDFTNDEFYKILESEATTPTTAQVTALRFEEAFKNLYKEGYTDVIVVTISSTGSNTYNNALLARRNVYEDINGLENKMKIHVIDSKSYSIGYGLPVIEAAKKAKSGVAAENIISYLEDWFASVEIYLAPFTLKYAKKSGRINAAAAFVGELMGLRPIILMSDGNTKVIEKVRGDKNIAPKLIEIASKRMIPETPYSLVYGSFLEPLEAFRKDAVKTIGYEPEYINQIGCAVAINAGPVMLAIVIKSDRKSNQ